MASNGDLKRDPQVLLLRRVGGEKDEAPWWYDLDNFTDDVDDAGIVVVLVFPRRVDLPVGDVPVRPQCCLVDLSSISPCVTEGSVMLCFELGEGRKSADVMKASANKRNR